MSTTALYAGLGAGLVASLITRAIERFGGRRGGVLGTLPTTIVPASLGVWSAQASAFDEAMWAVPAGMSLNALFLWLWRALPPSLPSGWPLAAQLTVMSLISLSLWAAGALSWVSLIRPQVEPLSAALSATLLIVLLGLGATLKPRPSPRGRAEVSWGTLCMRGLCAGLAVAAAVLLAERSSGVVSGVAAVFPAIFWTSMVSVWLSQGSAVSSGAVGPMMLGSSSVALYALVSVPLFKSLGAPLGALCAWLIAVVCASYPADLWLRRSSSSPRLSREEAI